MNSYIEGQLADQRRLKDQQFQEKHNEIQGMIDNLGTKLAAVPEDARNTPDYLKMQDQYAQAIQSRDAHWKSLDHPNAIMRFGKMIGKDLRFKKQADPVPIAPPVYGQPTMDVNGEKIPTGPAYKVQGPQTPAQMKAAAEAAQLVAAGPVSPEQAATQQGRAESAKSLAEFQGNMKLYDQQNPRASSPDATPEEKQARQEYANSLLQSPSYGKEQLGKWDRIQGKINGKPATILYNEKTGKYKADNGEDLPQDVLDSFVADPKEAKPGTSKFSVNVDSYKKMHGIPADQSLTPDQLNFVEQQIALSSGASSTNITNTLKQDVNGMWVPIQESNRHVSGFGTILSDPLGKSNNALSGNGSKKTSDTMATPNPKGLVEPGNIPIWNRPTVQNEDGSHSSEYSTSFNQDGKEVLVPTVVNGKFLTPDGKKPKEGSPEEKAMFKSAWDHYLKTGENLGKFDNPDDADAYANILHNRGAKANIAEVKNKAASLNQKPTGAPSGGGNVKVGAPLFQGRTPSIDGAQKDVKDAVALDSLAKQVEAKPNDAFNQKRLAVALERVSAGRFTVQALDYIKQIGWGASIEQWANNMTTGALPKELARQLVDGAHENLKSKQEALKYAITPIGGSDTSPNAGGTTPDAAAKSLADRLHEAYGTK